MDKIDFDELPAINVDCVLGLGAVCRVAESLKRNNKRFFSSPFDWMMAYNLKQVIKILKNKGQTFFIDCSINENYSTQKNKGIVDNKTGMISMHDIPKTLPDNKIPTFINKKYKYKFQRLDFILKKVETICILTNRNIDKSEILDFICDFTKLYKFKHLFFINVYDSKKESCAITCKDDKTIIELFFNDEHKNGRDKNTNPDFWLGNTDYWDKLLSKIQVNDKVIKKYRMRNFIFRLDSKILQNKIYIIISFFGMKIKFKI